MIESESREMYLKSIYELAEDDEPVAVSLVAKRLGVSAVSATEMVKRLAKNGLVDYVPYKGVRLTDEGCGRALSVVRRQRLWGRFLADHLNIPWAYVYDFACRLEHATDARVTEALADFLGHPSTCPHGNPIPTIDGEVVEQPARPLAGMAIGQVVELIRIDRPETTLCGYLAERGLLPGVVLTIVDEAPYNGPLTVSLEDEEIALGRAIAARIYVRTENDST